MSLYTDFTLTVTFVSIGFHMNSFNMENHIFLLNIFVDNCTSKPVAFTKMCHQINLSQKLFVAVFTLLRIIEMNFSVAKQVRFAVELLITHITFSNLPSSASVFKSSFIFLLLNNKNEYNNKYSD